MTVEEFLSLRVRLFSLFDEYNRQLYRGTTLDTHPIQTAPVKKAHAEPSHRSHTSHTGTESNRKRGRPKLDHNRQCYTCGTTKTSEWRTGEIPNTFLCNACGLKALKKKKRDNITPTIGFASGTNYLP